MDGSFSERYELIFPVRSLIVIFRSSLESKFKIAQAITKCTKHGSTSLVLPKKPCKKDLNICADISPNPDPVKSNDRTKIPMYLSRRPGTNAIDKSHNNIPEYNIVCKNRSSGSHCGVCLYLRNSISNEMLDHFHKAETEILWVKIRSTRLPREFSCIITGTLYHPPNSGNIYNMMLELVKSLTDIEGHYPGCGIILAGDFNRLNVSRLSRQFRMKQLVHLHTRGDQTLDLILTNLNKFYDKNSLSSFPPFGLSDHNVLLLNPKERRLFSSRDRKKVFLKRDTREIRKQELGRYLSSLNWDILNDIKSCNRKEHLFQDLIKIRLDTLMPLKKTKLTPTINLG